MPGSSPAEQANDAEAVTAAALVAVEGAPPVAVSDSLDANADPSPAATTKDAAPAKTLLDVTMEALKQPAGGEGASSGPEAKSTEAGDTVDPDAEAKAAAEEDLDAKLPFHKHPRWQEVQAQLKTAKANAEQFQAIEQFRTSNHLSVDEVADGWKVMALIKNDPAKALPVMEAYVASLREHLGMVLPKDLVEDVDAGAITEARALELSQTRASAARAAEAEAARRAEQSVQRRQSATEDMVGGVVEWEAGIKARDVDYAKKDQMVQDRIWAIISADPSRKPRNREQAVKLASDAYADVNKTLKGIIPPRSSTAPVPAGQAATATRAPKTPHEVTKAALGLPF